MIKDAAQTAEQGQMVASPSGGNRYIALNTAEPPFDDIDVRKAVLAASNRTALRNTRGGELIGPVATHFIPPGMPGIRGSRRRRRNRRHFLANPDGDMALAEQYMQAAGFDSGQCEGDCRVTIVGDGASPDKETTEVFVGTLEELGFQAEVQNVARDVMYTRFCNVPDQMPKVCPSVGWLKDFQDPSRSWGPTFDGEAIAPSNNSNWPLLDDKEINDAMNEADLIETIPTRAGLGRHRHADRRAGPRCPVRVGQQGQHPLHRRGRRDQPVQRELGPVVHLAQRLSGWRKQRR